MVTRQKILITEKEVGLNRRRFLIKMYKSVAAGAVTLSLPNFHCQNSTLKKKPNFVFILIDDLGWTDLTGCGSDFASVRSA